MTTTTPCRPRQDGKRSAFALSILVSLALNALALGAVMGGASGLRSAYTARTRNDPTIIATLVAASAPPSVEPRIAALQPEPAKPRDLTALPPRHPEAAVQTPRATQHAPMAAVKFYMINEVDQPASPDSDWNLDTGVLDEAGVTRLAFEVFISSSGEVVECRILEPATLPEAASAMLEDRLRHATLRPAQRAGAAVASFRRIELSMEPLSQ